MRLLAKDEENEKRNRELEDKLGARGNSYRYKSICIFTNICYSDRQINELEVQATERNQLVNQLCPNAQ